MHDHLQTEHLPWKKEQAHFSISGPWQQPRRFYLDVLTGGCVYEFAVGDDLSDDDKVNHWPKVEAADLKEIQQFVDQKVWKKVWAEAVDIDVCDAIWVHK